MQGSTHDHAAHDQSKHEHGHHHGHNHNLRAAYLHVIADALTSLPALVALLAANYFGATWMDPAMGFIGALLNAHWPVGLIRTTVRVPLEHQAPAGILETVPGGHDGRRRNRSDRLARLDDRFGALCCGDCGGGPNPDFWLDGWEKAPRSRNLTRHKAGPF
ncbi:MAG: cation transporter [Sedimentisphaerales bacterium]|nr:cation transporter [Sedimentisphaerales bacterium]